MGVPPQLSPTQPTGMVPPMASKRSRQKYQPTAEKAAHAPRPTAADEARVHGCSSVWSWASGMAESVPMPTVKRRMLGYASAAASSAETFTPRSTENLTTVVSEKRMMR